MKLKTKAGSRDVVLLPDLAGSCNSICAPSKRSAAFLDRATTLFTTSTGQPLNYRNVSVRGLDKAADAANLNPAGKPGSPSMTSATRSAATSR